MTLARWRGPSDGEPATSKTASTRVLRVLTFWPPGPPLREKRNSNSPRGMTTVRETRRPSMINPPYGRVTVSERSDGERVWRPNRAARAAGWVFILGGIAVGTYLVRHHHPDLATLAALFAV